MKGLGGFWYLRVEGINGAGVDGIQGLGVPGIKLASRTGLSFRDCPRYSIGAAQRTVLSQFGVFVLMV